MGLDGAGHADGTEEERGEPDEAEKRIHVPDGLAEIALALFHRIEAEPQLAKPGTHVTHEFLHVKILGKFEIHPVPREAARFQEARVAHGGERDEHAWRQSGHRRRLAGDFVQAPRQGELRAAELHFVPGLQGKLHHQGVFEDGGKPGGKSGPQASRSGDKISVERKSAFECPHLYQPRLALGTRYYQHGVEGYFVRLFAPQVADKFRRFTVQPGPGGHDQIGPQQGFGLVLDGRAQVVAQRPHGDERRHPQHDGEGEQQQAPPARARVPPGHLKDEVHRQWPTEHTEDTEESKHIAFVLNLGIMTEVHQQCDFQTRCMQVVLDLRTMLVRQG